MIDISKITDFKKEIYTIGFSNLNINGFLKTINDLNITVITDVRQYPYSTYNPEYNAENLKETLKPYRIYYRNYTELGEKQNKDLYYDENNIFKFKWYTTSANFKNGIEKINNALKLDNVVCLMGYASDPMYCHRAIMIGKYLHDNNYKVNHIITQNNKFLKLENQKELNERIIETYKTKINNLPEDKQLDKAYDLINKTIGYKSLTITINKRIPLYA